ncbi:MULTISPECIES: FKBP-type peptidyl-prolyl cis-trans isomerase [unclassified Actinotalea]|uniref:FKBP-type peptidyl-prolyl cis-trans isomerase n=1 Tax=unclassified Actinotalea TaxID=2638618 RepID=UPI002106A360|nr:MULTISPECIES: FKBP-type peptidyl-prolyl cis-trans isomerase [unclassified Actinotalea]
MRRRLLAGAVATAVAVAALAGCGPDEVPAPQVTVTGESGAVPDLAYEMPLSVTEPVVEVVWEGTGPEVVDGQPVLVDYYAEAGSDGTVVGETFSGEPKAFALTAEALGVDIYEALRGQHVGTRVLHVVPPEDGQSSATVAVFDLLPTRASGDPVEPREGLPTVTLGEHGEPTITVPAADPPLELVVQPLVRGHGPQVEPGQVITVQYTGVRWSTGEVFDSSWGPGELPASFPIGVGSVVEGWDEALVEQTVGSQVLIVVPPALGYGGSDHELAEETLVFVVDILAARGGPTGS